MAKDVFFFSFREAGGKTKSNFAPENGWLEEFPFGMAYFQGQAVGFRESTCSRFLV